MDAGQEAFIGLGSNLGDQRAHLTFALREIKALTLDKKLDVSSLYRTAPVGNVDQPDFYNCVARGRFGGTALELLDRLQAIEAAHQRKRLEHWGPRTLDLDILVFGHVVVDLPELQVPHPRMHERGFVLIPLAELAPELILPVHGKTAAQLWEALTPGQRRGQKVTKITWE